MILIFDWQACSEDHDVEIISSDDYNDEVLSRSPHIASTDDYSCTSDEIKVSIFRLKNALQFAVENYV